MDTVVDTETGEGSYMSLAFYHMIAKGGRLVTSIRNDGQGALHAATPPLKQNSPHANTRFHSPASEVPVRVSVRRITFRVVDGLPYGLIVGAGYLRGEESILGFGPGKGFKHSQNAPWIPSLDHPPPPLLTASLEDSRAQTALDATHRTPQSHEDMAWEDDSTLGWDVYLSNDNISAEGYVSRAVEGYAVGPMPQDK